MAAVDVFESFFDYHSVFVLERDDIGDGRYRNNGKEKTENLTLFVVWSVGFCHHCIDEFEDDTCTTEAFEFVIGGGLRVHDCDTIRDNLACVVVVSDDEVDTTFASIICLGNRGYAVIDGDYKVDMFFFHYVDVFVFEAVAVVATMREHNRNIFVADVLGDERVECP